jgi:glycosyltransferase involved in cell wall biosynthesis
VFHFNTALPYSALNPNRWITSYGYAPPSDLNEWDVVVGQRLAGYCPDWLRICADPRVLAVYSIDDDLTRIDPENTVPYSIYSPLDMVAGTVQNIQAADVVTVPTPAFAARVTELGAKAVHILPICIPDWHHVEPVPRAGPLTIGWSGSMFKHQDWPYVAEALREVADLRPEVRFHMIGADYTRGLLAGKMRYDGWQAIGDSYRLYDFHIGIAPLANTPFNSLKSRTKLVEYGAQQIPTVASNVGEYRDWIRDGENGLLVTRAADWRDLLLRLIDNPDELYAMGNQAWDDSREATIGASIHLWEEVYERSAE